MGIASKLFKFGLIKKGYEYYKNRNKSGDKTRSRVGGAGSDTSSTTGPGRAPY